MVWQSYGKAEPCLTSGGGAATSQPFVSRIASAQDWSNISMPLKRLRVPGEISLTGLKPRCE